MSLRKCSGGDAQIRTFEGTLAVAVAFHCVQRHKIQTFFKRIEKFSRASALLLKRDMFNSCIHYDQLAALDGNRSHVLYARKFYRMPTSEVDVFRAKSLLGYD